MSAVEDLHVLRFTERFLFLRTNRAATFLLNMYVCIYVIYVCMYVCISCTAGILSSSVTLVPPSSPSRPPPPHHRFILPHNPLHFTPHDDVYICGNCLNFITNYCYVTVHRFWNLNLSQEANVILLSSRHLILLVTFVSLFFHFDIQSQ